MNADFIFWAQALDNASPDHLQVRGKDLGEDDSMARQEAVSSVSRVAKSGRRLFDAQGVQLTADGQHFIIEVPSDQRDAAGRTAPIICHGAYGPDAVDELGATVSDGLAGFAAHIGRTLTSGQLEQARDAFAALKKKSPTKRLVWQVAIGAVALLLLVLAYRVVQG